MSRQFEVSYSVQRLRTVWANSATVAAIEAKKVLAEEYRQDVRIDSVIEHGIDPERLCEACEAVKTKGIPEVRTS